MCLAWGEEDQQRSGGRLLPASSVGQFGATSAVIQGDDHVAQTFPHRGGRRFPRRSRPRPDRSLGSLARWRLAWRRLARRRLAPSVLWPARLRRRTGLQLRLWRRLLRAPCRSDPLGTALALGQPLLLIRASVRHPPPAAPNSHRPGVSPTPGLFFMYFQLN